MTNLYSHSVISAGIALIFVAIVWFYVKMLLPFLKGSNKASNLFIEALVWIAGIIFLEVMCLVRRIFFGKEEFHKEDKSEEDMHSDCIF